MDYKTLCCDAGAVRKGRANIRCAKCGEDVTIECYLFYQVLKGEKEQKKDGE